MNIVREVPGELREFARLFEKVCERQGDYGSVYADFVDYLVGGTLWSGDAELAEQLKVKYGGMYGLLPEMVGAMVGAYGRMIDDDKAWYDGLGLFYECIASKYKSSRLGQFFTPKPVVDMMTAITNPSGESVSDCCCGSGRMLLSAKAWNPRVWVYGADLDPICAKMAAVNMAWHGCQGEVSCMNSLTMEWRFGYRLNPYFGQIPLPVPHLVRMENLTRNVGPPQPPLLGRGGVDLTQNDEPPETDFHMRGEISQEVKGRGMLGEQLKLF